MSERISLEETREYIIANSVPESEEERIFIKKYKDIFDSRNKNDYDLNVYRKLNELNKTDIAKEIYARFERKRDEENLRRYKEETEAYTEALIKKVREDREKALAKRNERLQNQKNNDGNGESFEAMHYVDNTSKEQKTKPKKRFFNWLRDNVGLIVLSVIVIAILVFNLAGVILSLFASFEPMVEFLTKIGGGYWFVGLIIVPFAIISLIQMYRGAVLLINADEDVFGLNDNRKTWKPPLYILINLLGLIALFIFLKRI